MPTTVFDDEFAGSAGNLVGHTPDVGDDWDGSSTYMYQGPPASDFELDGSGNVFNNAAGSSLINAVTALPADATVTVRIGWLTNIASHTVNVAFYTDPSDVSPDYRLQFKCDGTGSWLFLRNEVAIHATPATATGFDITEDIYIRATVVDGASRTFRFEYSLDGSTGWTNLFVSNGGFSAGGVYTDSSPTAGPAAVGIWIDGQNTASTGGVFRRLTVEDNAGAGTTPGSGTGTLTLTGTAVGGGIAAGSGVGTINLTGVGVGTTVGGEVSSGIGTISLTGTAVGTTFGAPAPTLLNTLAYRAVPIRFDSGYTPTRFRLRWLTNQLGEEELGPWQANYIVQIDSGLNTWKFGPIAMEFEGEIIVEDASAVARTMSVSARAPSNAFGVGYVNSGAAIDQLAFSVSGITLRPGEHLYEGRQLVFRSGPNVGMRREIRIHTYAAGVHRFEFTPAQRLPFLPEAGDWVEVV